MPNAKFQPAGGWSTDQPAEEIGPEFFNRAKNVRTLDGQLARGLPFEPILATPATITPPRWLLPNQSSSDAFWIYAGDTVVGVTDGTTHKDITPVGWTDHSAFKQPFTGGIVNQLPVVNARGDGPFYWRQDFVTPGVMEVLPDWPAGDVAQTMRPFREFLIAMDISVGGTQFPDLLRWSDAAPPGDVPQSWTPGLQSQAGELSVSFRPGEIVDGAQLLDRFYVYKTTSCYVMTLVGGVFVFNNRPVFATVGALARNCVVEYRGRHFILTDGDFVTHDGLTVTSLADKKVRREIFDKMDGDNFANSYIAISPSRSAIAICRPLAGEEFPSEALLFNLDDGTWGHQLLVPNEPPARTGTPHIFEGLVDSGSDLETTWDAKTTTWDTDGTRWNEDAFSRIENHIVFADPGGLKLQGFGFGTDQDGTPLEAIAERTGITLGDPKRRKFVRRVWPRFYGGAGNEIEIEIGAHDFPDQEPTYSDPQTFVVDSDRTVTVDVSGFYLAYRFRSVGGINWQLPSFELEFEVMGEF